MHVASLSIIKNDISLPSSLTSFNFEAVLLDIGRSYVGLRKYFFKAIHLKLIGTRE